MASISTAIELHDRVSAPINNIISGINHMIGVYESVERAMDGAFDTSQMYEARQAIDLAAREMEELEQNIRQSEQQQENYNRTVGKGVSSMDNLLGKAKSLVATYATLQTASKIIQWSDDMTQTTARLELIVDDGGSVEELQNKIYTSAQDARANYMDTMSTVSKLGLVAENAFNNNDELIQFSELVNKNFAIGRALSPEQSAAMYQLTQALGSGRLQGDEYRSIIENAPLLAKSIEDYMRNVQGVQGSMKEWAADGLLTTDVIKAAVFQSADEVEARFEQMPMTWSQIWTSMQNTALVTFQPILQRINNLADNQQFQTFAYGAVGALSTVAGWIMTIIEYAVAMGGFICQNWSLISPLVYGIITALALYTTYLGVTKAIELASAAGKVIMCLASYAHAAATGTEASATAAATAAQYGFNTALLACPITWIIIAIIALIVIIYMVIAAVNKVTGTTISATGVIVGVLMTVVAFIWNLFLSLVDLILGCINVLVNPWISFANFFGNLFNDPIASIIHLFGDMADNILGILETIASAIDKLFGSNLAGAVQGWRSGLDGMVENLANEYGNGSYEKVADQLNLSSESLGLKRWAYTDSYNTGYGWGEGIENSVGDMFSGIDTSAFDSANMAGYDASQVPSNISDTAENTGSMADSMEITSEDLKYLKDIAERDVVNKFTTAEIKINWNNTQNISSEIDLDGVVDYLTVGVNEAMEKAAEGVHV